MKNKIKVLVTGGAGYVGSATEDICWQKTEVYVIDNLMQGAEGASCFIGYPGYYFIKGDINDEKLLSQLIKKVDYVVHLAAIVGEGACKKIKFNKTNKY